MNEELFDKFLNQALDGGDGLVKFAELIIRECAAIANQAEQQCQHPATQILKHFGVSEMCQHQQPSTTTMSAPGNTDPETVRGRTMTKYYFAIEDLAAFWIVEKEFWDETQELDTDSDTLEDDLPKGFYRLAESVYEYDGDPTQGRALLLAAGFIENDDLLI